MAEPVGGAERRTSVRIPFGSRVRTTFCDGTSVECRARDLGLGGLLLYFDDELPEVGSEVGLHFCLDGGPSGIELKGRVVRHDRPNNGVGLAFIELSEPVRQALNAYILARG